MLQRIEKNKFREDLYYRLCVLELELPTLEERKDTTPEIIKIQNQLIKDALKKYNGNKTKVAKELGMSYTNLWRRLKKM